MYKRSQGISAIFRRTEQDNEFRSWGNTILPEMKTTDYRDGGMGMEK